MPLLPCSLLPPRLANAGAWRLLAYALWGMACGRKVLTAWTWLAGGFRRRFCAGGLWWAAVWETSFPHRLCYRSSLLACLEQTCTAVLLAIASCVTIETKERISAHLAPSSCLTLFLHCARATYAAPPAARCTRTPPQGGWAGAYPTTGRHAWALTTNAAQRHFCNVEAASWRERFWRAGARGDGGDRRRAALAWRALSSCTPRAQCLPLFSAGIWENWNGKRRVIVPSCGGCTFVARTLSYITCCYLLVVGRRCAATRTCTPVSADDVQAWKMAGSRRGGDEWRWRLLRSSAPTGWAWFRMGARQPALHILAGRCSWPLLLAACLPVCLTHTTGLASACLLLPPACLLAARRAPGARGGVSAGAASCRAGGLLFVLVVLYAARCGFGPCLPAPRRHLRRVSVCRLPASPVRCLLNACGGERCLHQLAGAGQGKAT